MIELIPALLRYGLTALGGYLLALWRYRARRRRAEFRVEFWRARAEALMRERNEQAA